jgi:hypothetical protein
MGVVKKPSCYPAGRVDLIIAGARGLGLTAVESQQLA